MRDIIEFIKNLSVWTKGAITLLTALVGFVFFFRENHELVILVTVFIANVIFLTSAWIIINSKTSPLIQGGKGVYKYPYIRKKAMVFGVFVILLDIFFSLSDFGRNSFNVAIYGTPTPTATHFPTATPSPIPPTPTRFPSIEELVKIDFGKAICGFLDSGRNFVIPDSIDVNQDNVLEIMKDFYNQKVWDSWLKIPDNNTYSIFITNTNLNGEGNIVVDNLAYIVIEQYAPLEHIHLANFSLGDGYYVGDAPCGGGAFSQPFDAALLKYNDTIAVRTKEFDYFNIKPGESEEFVLKVVCSQPGVYTYHIEMEMSYLGNSKRVSVSPSITSYCPKSYDLIVFEDVINDEPKSVYFLGNYYLQSFEKSEISLDPFESWQVVYAPAEPITYWVKTIPWKPCSDARESYIYVNYSTEDFIINPDLNGKVNLRKKPGINQSIIATISPGEKLIGLYDYECADGYVFWEVEIGIIDDFGFFAGILRGWVAESSDEDIIIQPCFGNPICDQ